MVRTGVVLNRFLKIVSVALVTALGTYALRTLLIEPQHLHEQCTAQPATALCVLRQTVIMGFVLNVYAIASVVLGAIGLMTRSRACAWAAIVAGVCGALLYRVEFAAVGLLCGALGVTRPVIRPQQGERTP